MTVRVNGENRAIPDGATVTDLLAELGLSRQPCAIEVNKRLVPKKDHAARPLSEGDVVEVVTLVGGG